MLADNSRYLLAAAQQRHEDAHHRAQEAIRVAAARGEAVSVTALAAKAGVSRAFLYANPDLIGAVRELGGGDAPKDVVPARQRATEQSLLRRVEALTQRNRELRNQNRDLQRRLESRPRPASSNRPSRAMTGIREIARRVLALFTDQKDLPIEEGPSDLIVVPEAAYCRGTQCWDEPATMVMDEKDYAALEVVLSSTSREPPGGWAAYCRDHLMIFLAAKRVDPAEPPWREDLIGCRVDGCPGFGASTKIHPQGETRGPAGDLLNGLCFVHTSRFLIYGSAGRPKALRGRQQCTYVNEQKRRGVTDEALMAQSEDDEAPEASAPVDCHEPSVANDLCLLHARSQGSGLREARAVLATWEDGYDPPQVTAPTDDTWRVLAEIQAITDGEPRRADLPYTFSGIEMGLSLVFGLPDYRHILHWAHKYSPSELSSALGMTPDLASAQLAYLVHENLIRESHQASLPKKTCLVVRPIKVSRSLSRRWAFTKLTHRVWDLLHYYPGYVVQHLPDRLPATGEERFIPVLEGPGVIELAHQGRCWELTPSGWALLRQWREDESEAQRRELAERSDRRLALIGASVGAMALVSIIADADKAWQNVMDLLKWLVALSQ